MTAHSYDWSRHLARVHTFIVATVLDACPRCDGKGLRPRTKEEDGTEADPDIHPFVAKALKTCERCHGSGRAELTKEEIAQRATK